MEERLRLLADETAREVRMTHFLIPFESVSGEVVLVTLRGDVFDELRKDGLEVFKCGRHG